MNTSEVLAVNGRVFKLYFTSLRDLAEEPPPHYCVVIAETAEEAIQIAKTAYPYKVVDSCHSDDRHTCTGKPFLEPVLLRIERPIRWIKKSESQQNASPIAPQPSVPADSEHSDTSAVIESPKP